MDTPFNTTYDIDEENGPGSGFRIYIYMEDLLDKLKLLNIEGEVVQGAVMKPLSRHYFAIPINPGEQFYTFTVLAAWLARKCNLPFEQPQESDDPNSTIANILDAVRRMGGSIDFAPNRLKQGYGEHVIFILNYLAEQALKASKFVWQKPEPISEEAVEETELEDQSEVNLERVEEEMAFHYSDDDNNDGEPVLQLDEIRPLSVSGVKMSLELQKPEEIMESNTDAESWKLEIERVMPYLKLSVPTDARDWRSHYEQMDTHYGEIGENLDETKAQLTSLHQDIEQTLEKVTSRERYLNSQLEHLLTEFRGLQDRLAQQREMHRQVNVGVTERTIRLQGITDEIDSIKQEMDERGSSMTDGAPLVNLRKSLATLRSEIATMDVYIGVAQHRLLQARMKDKELQQKDFQMPLPVNGQ